MGVSSPQKVGYDALVASDISLIKDATEYSTTAGTYQTVITGEWIEDIGAESKIRFKCDLKQAGGGWAHMLLGIAGTVIISHIENNVAYQTHTDDVPITWRRGDIVLVRIYNAGGTRAYIKNVEFAGNKSPVRLD
jgi:hypothetical protein